MLNIYITLCFCSDTNKKTNIIFIFQYCEMNSCALEWNARSSSGAALERDIISTDTAMFRVWMEI